MPPAASISARMWVETQHLRQGLKEALSLILFASWKVNIPRFLSLLGQERRRWWQSAVSLAFYICLLLQMVLSLLFWNHSDHSSGSFLCLQAPLTCLGLEAIVNNSPVKTPRQGPFGEASANTQSWRHREWLLWAPPTTGTPADNSSPRRSKFESRGCYFCWKKSLHLSLVARFSFPWFQPPLGSACSGAGYSKWTPTLFLNDKGVPKGKVFLAPFQVPTLKVFVHGKGSWREKEKEREGGRRGKKKKANIQNSRKSRPCCAELLQLFLFLLARSSGFTFSATAVHMSRKASSMAGLHRGGRGRTEKGQTGEGQE